LGSSAVLLGAYGKLPLSFEPNRGQADPEVRFLARGNGYTLFLTATETVLSLPEPAAPGSRNEKQTGKTTVLRMKLVGANGGASVAWLDELPGKSNYFIGNDPSKWRRNVPTYAKVRFQSVYPGVDLIYYGQPGKLEYDFVVAPGADPERIRFALEGASQPAVDANGDLMLTGGLRLRKPTLYQEVFGMRQEVMGAYRLTRRHVSFEVGAYDRQKPLVIDPVLTYSTFLAGEANGIAVDAAGNAYVAGWAGSSPPATGASLFGKNSHICVAKLNATGSALVYSAYLGGVGQDFVSKIALDPAGNAYVTGTTSSPDFPVPPGAPANSGSSAFVTKLNSSGNGLAYSIFIGGNGVTSGSAIAVDSLGSAYITGKTSSSSFPATPGAVQATSRGPAAVFVAKVNAAGNNFLYATYLGAGGDDYGSGIAVDSSGNAYVAGYASAGFPTTVGAFQTTIPYNYSSGFVSKLNASGTSLLYSTYLGVGGGGIAVDSSGSAYVTGAGFLAKLNPAGNALTYSTHFGLGTGQFAAVGVAVDSAGNATVTGYTNSSDFPTTADAVQRAYGGGVYDAFVTKVDATGTAILYSTYLGGSGTDMGWAVAGDSSGNVYVTGRADSRDFPAIPGGPQGTFSSSGNGFVLKLAASSGGLPAVNAGGVVDGAQYGSRLAAGGIVSIFGQNLAAYTAGALSVPLPKLLALTRVSMDGMDAPMFYASPQQINVQIPFELAGKSTASIQIFAAGAPGNVASVALSPAAPGIFTLTADGKGPGAILHTSDLSLVSPAKPAARNEGIAIYATGLGAVSPYVASGAPGPGSPLSRTSQDVTVVIGGITAPVTFSGLAPGLVGLYQVNAIVPPNPPTGNTVSLTLAVAGVTSNTVTIPVQ
jgi:uncharacterized protein (TIGR03437 family)